jgi:hypothetical protein
MHFRIRKNIIQLIRATYDASKKKGVNTIVGTVKLASPELSDELRQKLTLEEINALEVWINTQHRADMLREELAAMTLVETMSLAEKWFEREGNSNSAQTMARDILFQWQAMRRLFNKNELLD